MNIIFLKELRQKVDAQYVGFSPNGASVKPVHIYSGVSRAMFGKRANIKNIQILSYVSNKDGKTPPQNTLEKVKEMLKERDAIDLKIEEENIVTFRNILQKLIAADDGVFSGVKDSMVSYSAGSKNFITRSDVYEDAGEFVGKLISKSCPKLNNHIKDLLENVNDPISILFSPVVDDDSVDYTDDLDDLPIFSTPTPEQFTSFINGVSESGECLYKHLERHPNQLTQLRIFNLFCIYILIRYLSLLETFYCNEPPRPFFLDFSGDAASSIARTSVMSYTQIHRSISRFYAWGFAQRLKEEGITKDKLMAMPPPKLEKTDKSKVGLDERERIWDLAKLDAKDLAEDEALLIFGATIYDMVALESSANPVSYLRQIGVRSGLLYPPINVHINKRFLLTQDMLETIMRSCVSPDEVLTAFELKERLWKRFGIVIGGDESDIQRVGTTRSIISADIDALKGNFDNFAKTLEAIDFADIMADGILQIRLGGVSK